MNVIRLGKSVCERFILSQHYSRSAPIFWAGFGLVIDDKIEGVCVYGQPSAAIQKSAFRDRDFRLYELSRLVVQTTEKNAASFLVSHSLQMLGKCAVVSYADSEFGHCGFIYQATNWIYTGATISHDHAYLVDGKRLHPMTLRDQGITSPKEWAKANGVRTVPPSPKHRYFFLVGSSRQRKAMLAKLKYPQVKPYPKMEPRRYDTGPRIECPVERDLFSGK